MKNNKENLDFQNPMKVLEAFTQIIATHGFESFFGGITEKYPYERLGDGYELRPIELTEEESKDHHTVNSNYCHLYHNDLKVSDLIFRKGGMSNGFKDGYCSLINYIRTKEPKKNNSGFSFGTHVIINHLGEIALNASLGLDHPYHIGGHLAFIGNYIYDLRTGKAIAPKSSTSIKGTNCIIIEHRYDWYDKEVKLPLGIYKIDFQTAEITKIDEVK